MLTNSRLTIAVLVLVLASAACAPRPTGPRRVAATAGFRTPESVRYDADLDIYFVSNIGGAPSARDGDGSISKISPDGALLDSVFIKGGVNGVVLNAPKGMAIVGDTLWVTDIDAVRGFNRHTGAPVATVEISGAQFLNDLAVGPDGTLYLSDTGINIDTVGITHPGTDRIYHVATDRAVHVVAQGDSLHWPNGLTWDPAGQRFVLVPFNSTTIYGWRPGDALPAAIATGKGGYDGVERLNDGRFAITSWTDSTLSLLDSTGTLTVYIDSLPGPADIGYDTKRNRVAVPLFTENRVEIWEIR